MIADYVQKRKNGSIKSDLADESDLLSQFLQASQDLTETDIVDEVIDFLAAGTSTTQRSVQQALYYLMTSPDILSRVRAEFSELIGGKSVTD